MAAAAVTPPAAVPGQGSRPLGGSSSTAGDVDIIRFCVDAIEGFFKSISLSDGNSLQDTLRCVCFLFCFFELVL